MSNFHSDRAKGNAVEQLILELCQLQGIPAELNPTPDPDLAPDDRIRAEWYEGRAAYDIQIAGYWFDVKFDRASWQYRNFCVEEAGLQHSKAQFYIYAIPKPSSIYFHVVSVKDLKDLYESKRWPVKIVGDQGDNRAVHPPLTLFDSVGMNFYAFAKRLKQAA